MKKFFRLIASFALLGVASTGFAQQNPAVRDLSVTPSPALEGQTAQFSARIGNVGSQGISGVGSSTANRMGFTMGLSSGVTLAGLSDVTGSILTYFDLTWDPVTRLITGRQKEGVAIPAVTMASIAVTVTVNALPVSAQINVQPNSVATAQNQPPGDDAAEIQTALPVSLVEFVVAQEGAIAGLNWSTSLENNSDHFEVQASTDAKKWRFVGKVASQGESTTLKRYYYAHSTPARGLNYYRLKMVDRDGTYSYSDIKSLLFDSNSSMKVVAYPNPVSERLYLKDADLSLVASLQLYSNTGQLLSSTEETESGLNVKGLSSGLYLLKVQNRDGSTFSQKVMIK